MQFSEVPDPKCFRCGYDLRGRTPHDRCSECGAQVHASLSPLGPSSDPKWLLSLERGSELIAFGGLCYVLGMKLHDFWCVFPFWACFAAAMMGMLLLVRPSPFANPYRIPTRVVIWMFIAAIVVPVSVMRIRNHTQGPEIILLLSVPFIFSMIVLGVAATSVHYLRRARAARALRRLFWIAAVGVTLAVNQLTLMAAVSVVLRYSQSGLTQRLRVPDVILEIGTWRSRSRSQR